MADNILSSLDECIKSFSFDGYGWAPLSRPFSMDVYERWIASGFHGEMTYLERHIEQKREPRRWMNAARSALVVTRDYLSRREASPFPTLRIARYARGADYHDWFRQTIEDLGASIRQLHPAFEWKTFTDSSPVLERDLAYRAGLGWIGKNSCLIDPKRGSFFFIGGMYTNLEVRAEASPRPDHCGTCRRCIDACPTSALLEDRTMDARRCISYWTIEAKSAPPENLIPRMGDHFFGCDICQDVCPWNQKPLTSLAPMSPPKADNETEQLRWIVEAPDTEVTRIVRGTPLERAKAKGLKRNARRVLDFLTSASSQQESD